jgi:protein-S-isoprenylcysteine O-methyltransferase Ste14
MHDLKSILIPTLWLAWIVYWAISALRTRAVRRRESTGLHLSHTLPLLLGIALLVTPRWLPGGLSEHALPRTDLSYWLGVTLLVAGLALSVWARHHIAGWWSSAVTLKRDHELIRTGPYRWVRHPIYSGLLLGLLGTAITAGEWRSFLGVLVIAAAFRRKIAIEERFLTDAFPEDYARYRAEVATLLPFLY